MLNPRKRVLLSGFKALPALQGPNLSRLLREGVCSISRKHFRYLLAYPGLNGRIPGSIAEKLSSGINALKPSLVEM